MLLELDVGFRERYGVVESRELLGSGKSADVYAIDDTRVAKVFRSDRLYELVKEREAYKLLADVSGFVTLYESGSDYLVMDRVYGLNLYECVSRGIYIPESVMNRVDEALERSVTCGLNPNDVHLKNVMWERESDTVVVLDVARFLDKGKDRRWTHLRWVYHNLYLRRWFPRKFGGRVMSGIVYVYKRLETVWFGRKRYFT